MLILVLGILSIVMLPLLGLVPWILANGDLAAMDAGTMDPEGRDLTKVGRILGIIGTALAAISIISIVFFFLLFAGVAVTASA